MDTSNEMVLAMNYEKLNIMTMYRENEIGTDIKTKSKVSTWASI